MTLMSARKKTICLLLSAIAFSSGTDRISNHNRCNGDTFFILLKVTFFWDARYLGKMLHAAFFSMSHLLAPSPHRSHLAALQASCARSGLAAMARAALHHRPESSADVQSREEEDSTEGHTAACT